MVIFSIDAVVPGFLHILVLCHRSDILLLRVDLRRKECRQLGMSILIVYTISVQKLQELEDTKRCRFYQPTQHLENIKTCKGLHC